MQNRLRQAREERRLSVNELAEKLQVHQSSIRNWEAGRREIGFDTLLQIADILDFSIDYLLGRDIVRVSQTEPVNKESLRALHGQPVWTAKYGWMLVDISKSAFVAANLSLIPFDEVHDEIYIIPPAFALSLRGVNSPLELDAVLKRGCVWVEPITTDTDLSMELRGWYQLHNSRRLVENEYGHRFYLDTYGAKWLAFDNCIAAQLHETAQT